MSDKVQDGPVLQVDVVEKPSEGGCTTFRVVNEGSGSVGLIAGWLPHVVFRADEVDLMSQPALRPGHAMDISFDATYQPREDANEPSNPFLILRVSWGGAEWRVLARLRVEGPAGSAPDVVVVEVRAHRVGFSSGLT